MGVMQHFIKQEQVLATGRIGVGQNRLFHGVKCCSGHYLICPLPMGNYLVT